MSNIDHIYKAHDVGFISNKAKTRSISDLEKHLGLELKESQKISSMVRNEFTYEEWMAVCYKIKFDIINLTNIRTPYVYSI